MKEPYSYGKPLNGDYHPEPQRLSNTHDMTIARIQYFHDYLYNQASQLLDDSDDDIPLQKLLERIICVHYEIFQDFIYSEGIEDE